MAQIILNALTTLNLGTQLDPMFTELYGRWSRATFSGNNLVGLKVNTDTAGSGRLLSEDGNGWAIEGRIVAVGGVAYRATYTQTTGTFTIGYFTYNGTLVGSIQSTGTTTSYNTTSDARLKKDVVDAPEAGHAIDAMRVRSFGWVHSSERTTYGFVAQELHQVAPEAVKVGGDDPITDAWAVDPSKLVPLLVKELQSLRARVIALESL